MKKFIVFFLCVLVAASGFAQTSDAADIVESLNFSHRVALDFDAGIISLDGKAPAVLGGKASIADWLVVERTKYGISISATIDSPVNYELSGSLAGTLSLSAKVDYGLSLDGVDIRAASGPALNLQSKKTAFIVLAEGKANRLSDTPTRVKELDEKAALSSKGRIIISGSGSLEIKANYKNGIYSKEYLRIRSGRVGVTVTARDGIRTDSGFVMDGGELFITGTGTGVDEESKGIKVDGTEKSPGEGKIVINGGRISIRTVGKGMTAAWEAEEDATTPDSSDDPDPDVLINGGSILVTTTGKPYEKKDEKGNLVSCSPEGIEAKSDLIIRGGSIEIATADDCLNAGHSIDISGGLIYARSSANDAVDSNGTMRISGGTILAIGSGGPEGAFDCDASEFAITGGTILGFGGTTSKPSTEASLQNALILGGYKAGTLVAVKDAGGAAVFSFLSPALLSTTLISSPKFAAGNWYTIYTGGSISGGREFHGLLTGDFAVLGGSETASFTISGILTQLGGMIFGPPPGGAFPGGMPGGPPPEGMGPPPEGWTPPEGWVPPQG